MKGKIHNKLQMESFQLNCVELNHSYVGYMGKSHPMFNDSCDCNFEEIVPCNSQLLFVHMCEDGMLLT